MVANFMTVGEKNNFLPNRYLFLQSILKYLPLDTHFIFQLLEYPCNITHGIVIFIYHGYFQNKKNDISRIFLEHECIFCG